MAVPADELQMMVDAILTGSQSYADSIGINLDVLNNFTRIGYALYESGRLSEAGAVLGLVVQLDQGHLQADGEHACILHTCAESPDVLAIYVAVVGAEFEILDPPELAEHIFALAGRLTRAVRH